MNTIAGNLGIVTLGGTVPLTISGPATLNVVTTVKVTNTGGTTLSGQITDGSAGSSLVVTAASTGILILSNGTSNFSGGATLLGGSLVLGASSTGTPTVTGGPVGTGPLTLTGGTVFALSTRRCPLPSPSPSMAR